MRNGLLSIVIGAVLFASASAEVWTNPKADDLPMSFAFQGEYAGAGFGAQVIALNDVDVQVVLYPGGLPGDGWNGKDKSLLVGSIADDKIALTAATGERRYLAKEAAQFSATRQYPPKSQLKIVGSIADGTMQLTWSEDDTTRTAKLKKVQRKSPTLGAKPPAEAIVLFDGSDKDEWKGGRLDEKTKLLNTDGRDMLTKRKFSNYRLHLEFLMPFRPAARGQGRGNSGFYQVDHYEMQVLDSFGLDGVNNECGGIYQKADPLVNMCYPPLSWQTYDVVFYNAVADSDGKKVKNAILTAKLNGVVIHDRLEIDGKTGGSRGEPEGTPGPIKLQGHGNPLQYRNIWMVELPAEE